MVFFGRYNMVETGKKACLTVRVSMRYTITYGRFIRLINRYRMLGDQIDG